MITDKRKAANKALQILLLQNELKELRSDNSEILYNSYLREHIKDIFDFVVSEFPSMIFINTSGGSPLIPSTTTTYLLSITQSGKKEVSKFFEAGGFIKYNTYNEYLEDLANPQPAHQIINLDKSVKVYGDNTGLVAGHSSHFEDVTLQRNQHNRYTETGTYTTESNPKNWLQRNKEWVISAIVAFVIFGLSILAHRYHLL